MHVRCGRPEPRCGAQELEPSIDVSLSTDLDDYGLDGQRSPVAIKLLDEAFAQTPDAGRCLESRLDMTGDSGRMSRPRGSILDSRSDFSQNIPHFPRRNAG